MPSADSNSTEILDVWNSNLSDAFTQMRKLVKSYKFIAMDTEFPGVCCHLTGEFTSQYDYMFRTMITNVNVLKIIQVGLTFFDEHGNLPPNGPCTFQFNFKFNLQDDMYAQESIDLLVKSGLNFHRHDKDGIDPFSFAELLITSGLLLNDEIIWLSFHSGYDFAYLLRILTGRFLPENIEEFFDLFRLVFPKMYDVKYLMKSCKSLKGGLEEVSKQLDLERRGPQHQAGSDSLMTGLCYFKMKDMFFESSIDEGKYCGNLFGLSTSYNSSQNQDNDPTDSNAEGTEGGI